MLEIIVEENCKNREVVDKITNEVAFYIKQIVENQRLVYLRYFVVADFDDKNFQSSIKFYANIMNTSYCETNYKKYSLGGKVIEGSDKDGKYIQAVIVKAGLILGMYDDLLIMCGEEEKTFFDIEKNLSLFAVLHELGHVEDDCNIYKLRGYIDTKNEFYVRRELKEYILKTAFSLWGEYYAEAFPYRLLGEQEYNSSKDEDLIQCVEDYSRGKEFEDIVERVYRILYLFMFCLAKCHFHTKQGFDYTRYSNDNIMMKYVPFLVRAEQVILDLSKKYPNWEIENCMDEFSEIILNLYEFELMQE